MACAFVDYPPAIRVSFEESSVFPVVATDRYCGRNRLLSASSLEAKALQGVYYPDENTEGWSDAHDYPASRVIDAAQATPAESVRGGD